MINCSSNRSRWILVPTVPSGTSLISYDVYVNNTLVFVGNTKYFGSTYEVDMSDFIETQIYAGSSSVAVRVVFTYDGSTTQTMTLTWTPESISITPIDTTQSGIAYLELINSGFTINSGNPNIPLKVYNKRLVGKTTNKLDKITYIDRYSDTHNGGVSNRYEVECYIDSDWLPVKTGSDYTYEQIMMALQYAGRTVLHLTGGANAPGISGISGSSNMEGRVKDVERIETHSQYNTTNKVPTYKIVFEIYK